MAVSYFWTINPLEAYPTAEGETDAGKAIIQLLL
jgi:hypothetical protein